MFGVAVSFAVLKQGYFTFLAVTYRPTGLGTGREPVAPDIANGHRPLESLLYTAQLLEIFFCTGADCAGRRASVLRK